MEAMSKTSTFNSEDEHSTIGSLPRFKTATRGACLLSRLSTQNTPLEVCSLEDVEIPSDPKELLTYQPELKDLEYEEDHTNDIYDPSESLRTCRPNFVKTTRWFVES